MAPILSISKERMDAIRDDAYLCVVSIWQSRINKNNTMGKRTACRTGFVLESVGGTCIIITVSKGLSMNKKLFVRFEDGNVLEGSIYPGGESRLAAIVVRNLPIRPEKITLSNVEVHQCDPVVHIGFFHESCRTLGLSSGSVGLVNHNSARVGAEEFTVFAHCCSQKQYMIGAPVFDMRGHVVGVNISQKIGKNIFYAMNLKQICKERKKLFGENYVGCVIHILGLEKRVAEGKKRKMEEAKKREMEEAKTLKRRRTT